MKKQIKQLQEIADKIRQQQATIAAIGLRIALDESLGKDPCDTISRIKNIIENSEESDD